MADTLVDVLVNGMYVGLAAVAVSLLVAISVTEYRSSGPFVTWSTLKTEFVAWCKALGVMLAIVAFATALGTVLYLTGSGLWEVAQ